MNRILDYVMIFIVIAIFGVLIMYFIYNIWMYLIKPFIQRTMSGITNIHDKKSKKEILDKEAREILKPTCDEELPEDEYPTIKDDE